MSLMGTSSRYSITISIGVRLPSARNHRRAGRILEIVHAEIQLDAVGAERDVLLKVAPEVGGRHAEALTWYGFAVGKSSGTHALRSASAASLSFCVGELCLDARRVAVSPCFK